MKIEGRANLVINIVGLVLIIVAVVLKVLDHSTGLSGIYRIVVYLLFFTLWIVAVRYRVVQRYPRSCLLLVAGLELFWISVRSIKYEVSVGNEVVNRYLWYLYYLPMLMIPVFCFFLSVSMGRPENDKPRRFLMLFPAVALALFVLVMTNDLHGLVFVIPPVSGGIEVGNYSYGIGYAVVLVYIGLCALASYGIILVKCRRPGRRFVRFLPVIPLLVLTAACTANMCGVKKLFGFYQIDITMICCFCITLTLELCIQSGLILTNNGYDRLFAMSGIRAVITDNSLTPLISSNSYEDIPAEKMRDALKAPVVMENGYRLSSAKIRSGYVLWQDDISELDKALSDLSETNDYLQGKSAAIQQAYEFQKKERRLIEKNRLYNRVLTQTKPEIEHYAALIEQLAKERDPGKEKALAVRIAFVCAFIKRRDNLVFLNEEEKAIDPLELFYCVEESLSNLKLGGVECSCSLSLDRPLEFRIISQLYGEFYRIIYKLFDDISSVCVYLIEEGQKAVISMRISCRESTDLSYLDGGNIRAWKEDHEWGVTICA